MDTLNIPDFNGSWADTGYIALVFVLAGLVKGITGMGLPTVAVALLTLRMTPMQAAALLIVPSALTNVWQLLAGTGLYRQFQRLWPMLLGICTGTTLAGVVVLSATWAEGVLAAALLAYGLFGLSGWRWSVARTAERWLGPLAGACTGFLSGASGVFVIPVVPYLQALGRENGAPGNDGAEHGRTDSGRAETDSAEKETLIQAMGLAFTISTLALAALLAFRGDWRPAAAGGSFLAVMPALAGMLLGQRLRNAMRPALFRRCFFIALLLLGAHLGWQSLAAGGLGN
jgi:uncharacterized protein